MLPSLVSKSTRGFLLWSNSLNKGSRLLFNSDKPRHLSSETSGGLFSRIKDSFGGSSSQDDAYAKQISQMANSESWSLTDFQEQIKESSGGWKSKLPGMGSTDAVKQMKEMQKLIDATIEIAGKDAGASELKNLGKKEKVSE